jgi:hypothetical protein
MGLLLRALHCTFSFAGKDLIQIEREVGHLEVGEFRSRLEQTLACLVIPHHDHDQGTTKLFPQKLSELGHGTFG